MRSCEQLLTSGLKPNGSALSQDEVQMVEAYVIELKKLLKQSTYQRSCARSLP